MASVAEAQKHASLRRFVLRKQPLQVGGRCFSLVVPDAKEWIRRGDWTAERLRGGEPPYWVQIWPAATALARHIGRNAVGSQPTPSPGASASAGPDPERPLSGKRVLDLGCGLGVPGCVAGLLGAQVTFADRTADALAFATWNAMQLSGRKHEQQQIDWSRQTVAGVFDMILLADVSYHVMHHVPLLEHLSRCLIPGGVVLHADPFRDASTRFLVELSTRLGTKEADVVVREGADSKLVRVVVASSCSGALLDWSRSFGGSRREG